MVRALMDGRGPIGVRALAQRAQVGVATSSRVLELLTKEILITRGTDGSVQGVRKRALLRHWTRVYGLTRSNAVTPSVALRGLNRTLADLRHYQGRYSLTGSAASRAYLPASLAPITPLTVLAIFVDDPFALSRELRLRPTEAGANVLLVEPFDEVVHANSVIRDGLRYASPSQTAADLLTGPGRSAEEAEQLLDVLAADDEEWAR